MIEGYVGFRHNVMPFSDREGRVSGGDSSNEVVFPCLDGVLGSFLAMVAWGHALK